MRVGPGSSLPVPLQATAPRVLGPSTEVEALAPSGADLSRIITMMHEILARIGELESQNNSMRTQQSAIHVEMKEGFAEMKVSVAAMAGPGRATEGGGFWHSAGLAPSCFEVTRHCRGK